MPAHRLLPPDGQLVSLREQGWSYDDIASQYGVTKGAVYLRLRAVDATKPRPSYRSLLPWTVKREHRYTMPAEMLRLCGRREANEAAGRDPNAGIPPAKLRMLDKWLREVEEADVVVDYDPAFPPNPASPYSGGFHYRRRVKADGDGLIREPKRQRRAPKAGHTEEEQASTGKRRRS